MSLSNSSTANWGTIFMGPERLHETTLSRLENTNSGPVWGDDTEVEYFERIKAKATQKAMQILAQAQADADAMLAQAQAQGYEQGLAQAQAELDEFRQAAGNTAAAVLSAIEAQTHALTSAWEKELTQLVKIAVQAGIGRELSENRAAVLDAMFYSAVQELASEQRALVCVNPEDEAVVADIIAAAGQNFSERFQTKADPALSPGSIVLESNLGRLENTLEQRRLMVDKILKELVLSENNTAETQKQNNLSSTAHEPNYAPSVQPEPVETVAAESMPIETISVEHMPAENIAEAQPEVDFSQAVEVVSPQLEEIEEATEQALINSPEQQAESFMEEDFTSPLDNLPVQEGSLIPEAILNDQALHTQNINEPEISSQEITHTLEETPEELLQAQEQLEALDHLLEDEASNQKTKQNHTEVDAQANTQADADAYINALLAEEKN